MPSADETLKTAVDHHDAGRLVEAEAIYRRLLEDDPHDANAWHLLGLLSHQQGRAAVAIEFISRALQITEGHPTWHYHLGCALSDSGELEQAADHFRRAFTGDATSVRALNNFGGTLRRLGRFDEAIEALSQAVDLDPSDVNIRCNLAAALQDKQLLAEAADAYQKALEIDPEHQHAREGLGKVSVESGEFGEAIRHYRHLTTRKPEHLLWQLRADTLRSPVFFSRNEIDEQLASLSATLRRYDHGSLQVPLADVPYAGCMPPWYLSYQHANVRDLKQQYAALFRDSLPRRTPTRNTGKPRIGFVVTAGHEHIFLRGMGEVLRRIDRDRFEIGIVCAPTAVRKLKQHFATDSIDYVPLASDFSRALDSIAHAQFDLLYYWEVGTDAMNYFLPFFRLAAVQCTSWGWPVTSGIDEMDYFISSTLLETAEATDHYSEQLVRLESLPNYYTRPEPFVRTAHRADFGLEEHARIYFCQQNLLKLHPDMDVLLAEILRRDPRAVVVLVEASRAFVGQMLRQRFSQAIPDVVQRVRILPRLKSHQFLQLTALADVLLDTRHYGGGANTVYDAIHLGIPLVTWPGEFHRGRYAAAAFRKMEFHNCTVGSGEDYVSRAIEIACNPLVRDELSRQLSERSDQIFGDTRGIDELADFFEHAILSARQGTTYAHRAV